MPYTKLIDVQEIYRSQCPPCYASIVVIYKYSRAGRSLRRSKELPQQATGPGHPDDQIIPSRRLLVPLLCYPCSIPGTSGTATAQVLAHYIRCYEVWSEVLPEVEAHVMPFGIH